jgi:enoyl-CoA hydratase/carnithine racemase
VSAGTIRRDEPLLHVVRLTLDRPKKLNAFDLPMLAALDAELAVLEADTATRVVILAAEGGKAFCAGADIAAWGALEPLDMWRRWISDGNRLFDRLARLRPPVIAAIDGIAFGGGLELALCADLRIATAASRVALPETGVGTIPGWSGIRRLVRLIGLARAKAMVLTGAPIDAPTALAHGLISEVVADRAALDTRVLELAAALAERAPVATQLAKALLDEAAGEDSGAAIQGFASAVTAFTADGKEGVAAFRDKRTARFIGS